MKIAWLPIAARNRADSLAYLAERNPQAAIALGDAIETAIKLLQEQPRIGRVGRVHGTREWVVTGTEYIIAYRLDRDTLLILRFLHGAQKWPPIL